MKDLKIFIITGLSGSGKSSAIAVFEDAGYYCVDNLPIALLPKFLDLPIEKSSDIAGLAFVMDLREKGFLTAYPSVLKSLRQKGYKFEILFLEADEDVLIRRYSQTRRPHPLAKGKSVLEGIRAEIEQLKDLRCEADRVINTSIYNVHAQKAIILDIAQKGKHLATMRIHILSFGFKYGVPHDADLMMDVRFLPNPYFVPELKDLDGTNPAVYDFVFGTENTREFLGRYLELLDFLLPLYEKEGKSYLTIAVGCTGGRHRSVSIAQEICKRLKKPKRQIEITHRDINQEAGKTHKQKKSSDCMTAGEDQGRGDIKV